MPDDINPDRVAIKRGPGRPRQPDTMPQISLRIPQWMLDDLDAINEHERYNQSDRAGLIREAIARFLDEAKR